jgi:hypothetical protein
VVTGIAASISLDLRGTIVSLNGVYDCPRNRKAIFNRGMVPNINPNPRGRKFMKRGRKPIFDEAIFQERFSPLSVSLAGRTNFAACRSGSNVSATCITHSNHWPMR